MKNSLAQIKLYQGEGLTGPGDLANTTGNGVSDLAMLISRAIGVMTIVAIIWFVFIFITGAISIIGSGGDKQALEGARKRITTGALGLLIVVLAIIIMNLIGRFIGIPNILDITALFGRV